MVSVAGEAPFGHCGVSGCSGDMAVAAAASIGISFVDKVQQFVDRVEYRRVENAGQLEDILSLRYEAYINEGALDPHPSGKLEDQFDGGTNVRNIGLYLDGSLISALRLHILYGAQRVSPAMESFPEWLGPRLDDGKVLLDPNRFVADYRQARSLPELPYATLRLAIMAADYFNVDLITATVRAEHQAFYRRVVYCHPVCSPRPYPKLTKPIGLMAADFKRDHATALRRYPFFSSTCEERHRLFGNPLVSRHAFPSIPDSTVGLGR
jgi:hypothetical protein